MKKKSLIWWLKKILFVIPFLILGLLLENYFSFSGNFSLNYDFDSPSPFISNFTPLGRAGDPQKNLTTGETYQQVMGEPVYLPVNVPLSYDSVDVTLEYKNPNQSLLKFGLVASENPWSVNLKPLENKVIDEAFLTWDKITNDDGVTLLQRQQTFSAVDDFLHNLPINQAVGAYQYDLAPVYQDNNYQPQNSVLTIDQVLRGGHEFAVYVKDEVLHAEFDLQDLNYETGADEVKIELFNPEGVVIDEKNLADDGIANDSKQISDPRTLIFDVPNLSAGAYHWKITADNDLIIKQIRTKQHQFVAQNHLFLFSTPTSPATLFFNGSNLTATTTHVAGLQELTVGDDLLNLTEVNTSVFWEGQNYRQQLLKITLPKSDVYLQTAGYFSFVADNFFDPDYLVQNIDENTADGVLDYIIFTDYQSPQTIRNLTTQTVHLDLAGVAGDRKNLLFILSAPGINRRLYSVQVNQVWLDFHRAPLLTRIFNRFKK